MQQIKKMGPLSSIVGMLPGMPKELKQAKIEDDQLKPVEAIIHSMTTEERRRPEIINGSRRLRIARGSGSTTSQVNALLKQFDQARRMMKSMMAMAGGPRGRRMGIPGGAPPARVKVKHGKRR
jgi:signal recognition particle subunit SRP54